MTSIADLRSTVDRALLANPTATDVAAAAEAIDVLAGRAYGGREYDAYEVHQALLFELHYGDTDVDHWTRQYLASRAYEIESTRIHTADTAEPMLTGEEFRARLWAQQSELTPLDHPMFQLLFSPESTLDQITVYLRQQWLILQFFWLQFVELASQLERRNAPIEALIVAYENVWDELGCGEPAASHVVQHRTRQDSLGISTAFRQVPDFPETMDYINTRLRLMRAHDPAAALGSIFSQEATAQSYGSLHNEMLERVGIPVQHRQVYADHTTIDVTHTEEVVQLAESMITSRSQQEEMLAGHRAQMLIWLAHMDRVVPLLIGEPQPEVGVPSLTEHMVREGRRVR